MIENNRKAIPIEVRSLFENRNSSNTLYVLYKTEKLKPD